jgi:hypothetical protein
MFERSLRMTEQALGVGLGFFTCEVRDIRDPDKAGKVKVIVHGHHNIGDNPIPDEELPWAYPIMNNTPSLNKIGTTTNYLPGTCLIGFWLDPETKQIPCVVGSMHRAGFAKDASLKDPEPDGSNDGNKSTPGKTDNPKDPGQTAANQKNIETSVLYKTGGPPYNENPDINNNGLG